MAGSSYERGREAYDEQRTKGYIGLRKRHKNKWYRGISFRVENVDVDDIDFDAPKEVTDVAFNQPKIPVKKFLDGLGYFCSKNNIRKVFAQGTDFDIAMISHIHNQYNYDVPWDFWLVRDTRTVYDFMKSNKPTREGTHHNALDDAVYQAECVIQALKEIR